MPDTVSDAATPVSRGARDRELEPGRGDGRLALAFDGLLLDLDGVVYIGPEVLPHVAAVLRQLRRHLPLGLVTNNAARTPHQVAAHLTERGVECAADEVLTSAQLAAGLLTELVPAGSRVLVVGGRGLTVAVEAVGLAPVLDAADDPAAVVQGFGPDVGWRELSQASVAVAAGVPWVASNLDLTLPTPFGQALGNGSLVRAVSAATGREPDHVAGKPDPRAFSAAAERWGMQRPLVVGDRLDTDIAGAHAAGFSSLLVLTGVTTVVDLLVARPSQRPTFIGSDLRALLSAHRTVSVEPPLSSSVTACVGQTRVTLHHDRWEVSRRDRPLDVLRAATAAYWQATDSGLQLDPAWLAARLVRLVPDAY